MEILLATLCICVVLYLTRRRPEDRIVETVVETVVDHTYNPHASCDPRLPIDFQHFVHVFLVGMTSRPSTHVLVDVDMEHVFEQLLGSMGLQFERIPASRYETLYIITGANNGNR